MSGWHDMTSRFTHSTHCDYTFPYNVNPTNSRRTIQAKRLILSTKVRWSQTSKDISMRLEKVSSPLLEVEIRAWTDDSEPERRVVSRLSLKIIQSRIHLTLGLLRRLRRLIMSELALDFMSTSWRSGLYYPFSSGIHRITLTWISLMFRYLPSLLWFMWWTCRWAAPL